MALNINIPQPTLLRPRISVFGVGGAGGNALNNMIKSNLEGVEFIAANTDAQALSNSLAANRIQLGVNTTRGLGAGSFPDRGRAAAEENIDDIIKYLDGNNMIFIAAGMGGGTGTGAAPVIGKLARERDILAVGVVTKPFHFEGKYRMDAALAGIEELKKHVDTLIVIPNQNLFRIANEHTTFESAFKMADDVLHAGVRGVTDLITMPGLVNLDFADIRTIMTKMGKALMGTGEAEGENRAVIACQEAISNPLLDDISIKGAKGVLVNMTGGPDMTLFEADLAVNTIKKEVDSNANIIFGSAFNEDMKGKIRISVVATGIEEEEYKNAMEAAKPKVSSINEVKNKNAEAPISAAITQGRKTFFDPGMPKLPEVEVLEEVIVEAFVPQKEAEFSHKNHHEEELPKKSKVEVKVKNDDIEEDEKRMILNKINFINNTFEEEEDRFGRVVEKISKLEERIEKKAKSAEEKGKRESGGFSLFNFMNPKKSSEIKEEKKATKPLAQEKHHFSEETKKVSFNNDEEFEMEVPLKKSAPNHKKNIDQTPEPQDFNMEDDILNVPAFFRRKK